MQAPCKGYVEITRRRRPPARPTSIQAMQRAGGRWGPRGAPPPTSPARVSLNPRSYRGTSWSPPNVERMPSLIPLQDRLSESSGRAGHCAPHGAGLATLPGPRGITAF